MATRYTLNDLRRDLADYRKEMAELDEAKWQKRRAGYKQIRQMLEKQKAVLQNFKIEEVPA